MATKPSDIGESCYLFDTFGKCAYGLTCRFAKAHTTPDFKTMEKAELIKAHEGKTPVKNSLTKDLQNRLRKRSVSFKKSGEYLKTLSNNKEKKEQQTNGKTTKEVDTNGSALTDIACVSALSLTVCCRLIMSLLSGLKLNWHWKKCSN